MIFNVTYGRRLDNNYLAATKKALEGLSNSSIPGAHWIEFIPLLKHIPSWIPGSSSKKIAESYKPYVITMLEKPYTDTKAALVSFITRLILSCAGSLITVQDQGTASDSIAATVIESNRSKYTGTVDEAFYDEVGKNATGVAYAGTWIQCSLSRPADIEQLGLIR